MNKIIDFKIDNRTVVYIPTEELLMKVDELLDNLGARCWHGGKYLEDYRWAIHKENTCYDVHEGGFSNLQTFLEDGYDIISAEDFLKLHEPTVQNEPEKKEIDFKIDKKTVVNARTETDAINLCKLLDKLGATWIDGLSYTQNNYWCGFGSETCYDIHTGHRGNVQYYVEERGYNIISVDDFIELHEPKTISESLNVVITSLDYVENQLIRLFKKHNDHLLEGKDTDIKIQHIIDIGESIKLLKAANCKLHTLENQ